MELTGGVAEEEAGLGSGFVKGSDEEVGEAIGVGVAPGCGVSADAREIGEEAGAPEVSWN